MLGSDRFQKFVQALLVTSFPNLQCLPLNQADGGRDAFARGPSNGRIIFQVKFSYDPNTKDARKVIRDVITSEREKVSRLLVDGATSYILVTNVRGTAHPGSGSIDQAERLLTEAFGPNAQCWWRDDLDARVSANSDIQSSYAEILKGSDVIGLLASGGFDEYLRLKGLIGSDAMSAAGDQRPGSGNPPHSNSEIEIADTDQGPVLTVSVHAPATGPDCEVASLRLRMLIDTGAAVCCIDSVVASQLGLPIVDVMQIATPTGGTEVYAHLAQLEIISADQTRTSKTFTRLIGVDLAASGLDGLLGREILKQYELTYGPRGVTLAFAPPKLDDKA